MKVSNRDIIKIFWKKVCLYKVRFFLIILLVIVAALSDSFRPIIYKQIIDLITETITNETQKSELLLYVLQFIGILLFSFITWRLSGILNCRFQPRVMSELEKESFSYLIRHSFSFFSDNFSGALVRKIRRISSSFERLTDEIFFRVLPVIATLIGTSIGLFIFFPVAGYIFIGWFVLFVYLNYKAMLWKLKIDIKKVEADSETTAIISDAISNSSTIKLFANEHNEEKKVESVLEKWKKFQIKSWGYGEIINGAQAFLMVCIEGGLLWYSVVLWMKLEITAGTVVLVQSFLVPVFGHLWDIGRSFRHIFEALADAREMVEILKTPHEVRDIKKAKNLRVRKGAVLFSKLTFSYAKKPLLSNFNLLIAPREKVALVGPSGAGKSTILKLLLRFHDPQKGAIRIDGQNIAKVTQESLRKQVAIVPQEPILFHRSLRDNIAYGNPNADEEQIFDAAKKARCHEFITRLKHGYDTFVGERGIKLSGGERQRVAIARAILTGAPILVLDEATSSLDSESEYLIQLALRELMKEKTVIVIAHRLSTIMAMDRIVVMQSGKIVSSGTHEQLYKKDGIYKTLWDIQAGGFINEEQL